MRVLIIYYDENDSVLLNYVREFSEEISIFTPDENSRVPGYENIHGNILEILEKMKNKFDVIAIRRRKNYPAGDFFVGNLIDRIKSMGFRVLVVD